MFTIYLIIVFLLSRLKKINEELEERVRLRTEALTREIQERMRLQKELLETGEREQRRIGRDLHDGLCQQLTGTALTGHLLAQKLTDKAADEAVDAARLVELLEETIEMTRNLSHELSPVELQTGRLTDHFEKLAADTCQRFKVECKFESSLSHALDDAMVGTHLYRIAQEAVVHAAKHSRAGRINIGLDSADDEIVLSITDDGTAVPEKTVGGAQGPSGALRTLAYRADLIGASFNIERLATRGTRVTCVLPLTGTNHGTKD
jgi:signal transduction histidine kinase